MNNITDACGHSQVFARWVSRSLGEYQRNEQEEICSHLLSCYEGLICESFLSPVVIVDKTQIQCFKQQILTLSVEWHFPIYPWKKKFKATPSARKVMATVFLDAEGVILVDIIPCE